MTDSQKWLTLTFILVTGWLTYLSDPLADKLEVIKVKNFQLERTNAVIVVFIAIFIATSTNFLVSQEYFSFKM